MTPEIRRLHLAHVLRVRGLRASVVARVLGLWDAMPDRHRPTAEAFAEAAAAVVTAGQRRMGLMTDVYLSRRESLARGVQVPASGVGIELDDLALRGVAATAVYLRPAETVWWRLSEGDTLAEANAAGRLRLERLALTDVQLAKTHAARESGERRRIVGYRRELEGPSSCGLCIAASTQRYGRGDLLPIHTGCDCSVAEIYGDADPGQVIEPERLENLDQRVEEAFGRPVGRDELRRMVVTHEHGELGPVLAVRGQKFSTAADL